MKNRHLTKYWILLGSNSIFRKPYPTLEEAQKDLNMLNAHNPNHGFVLQERETWKDEESVAL